MRKLGKVNRVMMVVDTLQNGWVDVHVLSGFAGVYEGEFGALVRGLVTVGVLEKRVRHVTVLGFERHVTEYRRCRGLEELKVQNLLEEVKE